MLRLWKLELKINDAYSHFPLYRQITETIIDEIELGTLKSGTVLPGTRKLALLFNVSRNTILEAFNCLEQEGWLKCIPRIGTYISDTLPINRKAYIETSYEHETYSITFDQGLPDASHSPISDIMREYKRIAAKVHKRKLPLNTDLLGDQKLRIILSQMLAQQRRIKSDENNICITRGSQMGIFLVAQCLLKKKDYIIVEHPGYRLAWDAFKYAGASILFAQVDKDGILTCDIKRFIEMGKRIKAVYVSPNCQFPTTAVLSETRREELIELSNKHNFFIIEDDYCIDLNYSEIKLFPLCSDRRLENYIYIGTFSRSISPILKLGYLVSSHHILERIIRLRRIIDIGGDIVMERAFFRFIQDGVFSNHVRKQVSFYRKKRDMVAKLLNIYLGNKIIYKKPDLGLGYWIEPIKPIHDFDYIIQQLKLRNINLISFRYYQLRGSGFYLSFGSIEEDQLERGIQILAEYL